VSIRSNIDAAEFDQKIYVQRKSVSQDIGRVSEIFTTIAQVWARVDARKVDNSRREQDLAGKLVGVSDFVIWVRADVYTRLSISLTDRILWRDRVLDIVDIMNQQLSAGKIAMEVRYGPSNG